jgi:hypothetical protein
MSVRKGTVKKQNLRKCRVMELPGRHVGHVHENSDGYGEVGGWEGALRPDVGEGVVTQSPRPPLLTPPLRGRPAAPKQVHVKMKFNQKSAKNSSFS